MLKRPQWVKEKINGKEKEVPLQMTVKKKYTLNTPYANMPTMGTTTGNGVDGMVQPGKMVDIQVHEGEGIIPNNAMQGLTENEFQGLVETLSSGNIDKNKLREAINMPTVQEYQAGGVVYKGDVPSSSEIPDYSTTNITNRRSRGVPGEGAKAVDPEPPPTKEEYLRMRFPTFGTDRNQTLQTSTVTRETPTAPTIRVRVPQQQTIATSTIPAESRTTAAETTTTEPPEPVVAPPEKPPETIQTKEVQRETPETPVIKAPLQEMPTPPEETVTQPVVSPAGEMVRQGLQKILAEAQGVSEVDRKIANFYLQNTDASNAANLRILESQISADPNMSDQAKRAAIAGLQREAAANRSQLTGELAINSMERASQAARDIVTYGGQVRTYEEIELPTSRQNLEIERRIFDEFTTPMNALELEEKQKEMGVDNWNRVQDLIDKGLSLEKVNVEMAKMGMQPLTLDEFSSIYQAGDLGERNWSRQESAAKLLVDLGQWDAAAKEFSNIYNGVDFDFSKLATQETALNFSQGISQMATYLAANWDADRALKAAKIDGTMQLMGINEEEFRDFYNVSRVNALDKAWEEVETSKEYQRMLNSADPAERQEALDMKHLFYMDAWGQLDREILHEYKITGPNNKPMGSIYAKNAEEAQAKADEYGVGYTIEDTGNISTDIVRPPETEVETGIASDWEEFKTSVPPELITPDLQESWQSWIDAGNTGKYDEYRKSTEGKLQSIDVERTDELLNGKNPEILSDAYGKDPEIVKEKGYYYTPPTYEELKGKFTTKTGGWFGTGKTTTTVDPRIEVSLNNSVGLMTEIPMKDGTVVGQVQDVSINPHSVTMKIRKLNGEVVTIPIYDSDHHSYRPQPKYYGRK